MSLINLHFCDPYLYFLIGICIYVVIDIIYLFINVIQVEESYIYIFLLYNYYRLTLINKLNYLLISVILHNCY